MALRTPHDRQAFLQRNPWFAGLSLAVQAMLAEGGRAQALDKGQWLFSEGDAAVGLYAVLTGRLRIELSVGPTRDVLFEVVGPGSIIGHATGFGVGPRLGTVRAGTKASVLAIPASLLKAAAETDASFPQAMSELLYASLAYALLISAGALCLSPRARVAGRLVLLTQNRLDGVRDFAEIAQGDLAEMTALSRKSVNGHLKALQRMNIIRPVYGGVRVLDPARLGALVG
jgi:CRP/FNR family cyclic AMP-dependent transcriptional regulator